MIIAEILAPLINNNEPEARVIDLLVHEFQSIKKGDALLSLETTKATVEIVAPEEGYIRLFVNVGDIVSVGTRIAVITDNLEPIDSVQNANERKNKLIDLRITQPARVLAEIEGIDLSTFPVDRLITLTMVQDVINNRQVKLPDDLQINPGESILVFGGGGHAKSIIELIRSDGKYQIIGIVDDNLQKGNKIINFPILGSRAVLTELLKRGLKLAANGVGGITDIQTRVNICGMLELIGFYQPKLIHQKATIESSSKLDEGVQVFANAYIGAETTLRRFGMINTNAVVSHDCEIGEFSHIAPGALLAGHVKVGEKVLVGMGVSINIGVKIGSGARIGNGSIILKDVPSRSIIPAGTIWKD